MKKAILTGLLCGLVLFSSGCLEKNNLDNATIYTTVYPIQYFTEVLYGTHSKISSIYPDGANVLEYSLTDKQKNAYSKGDIFIYNGSTNEKQIAKDFTNKNKRLQIIDAAYGLRYKNGPEELWLSPNNALMLATNIKDSLKSFITSKFINEEIDTNYKKLEETLSLKDAEIRNIARTAADKGKNTLIFSSDVFYFLEDYGFQVISLENNTNDSSLSILKRNFKNGTYKYLFIVDGEENNDTIKDFKSNGATLVSVNTMATLNDTNRINNDNYLIILQEFIENIKNAVLN